MLVILSPAKTMDFKRIDFADFSVNPFLEKSQELISCLRTYSLTEIKDLMKINDSIAALNIKRFGEWLPSTNLKSGKQAVFAYHGEVYNGLQAKSLSSQAIIYSQKHLRIISGLYGVLRPLDLIAAYRLEMGILLQNSKGNNLYKFWNDIITNEIQEAIDQQGDSILVNLASAEYSKAVNLKKLNARIISPEFKNYKNGDYKVIVVYAKKARGLMTRFILENQISDPELLKNFDSEGYFYNEALSSEDVPVFTR